MARHDHPVTAPSASEMIAHIVPRMLRSVLGFGDKLHRAVTGMAFLSLVKQRVYSCGD